LQSFGGATLPLSAQLLLQVQCGIERRLRMVLIRRRRAQQREDTVARGPRDVALIAASAMTRSGATIACAANNESDKPPGLLVGASVAIGMATPQSPQKRLPAGFSAPHFAQRMFAPNLITQ